MIKPYNTQAPSFLDHFLSLSGIAAPIVLLFAVLICGIHHPGYSHCSQAISELGARGAPSNALLNFGGLVPTGILTLAFSLAMFRRLKKGPALYISSGLVALVGIGRFFAGIFPCDPGCFTIITISGWVHALSGVIAMFAGSAAPLVMAFGLSRQQSKGLFHLSLVLGLVALILFIALVSQLWLSYFGAIQRLLLVLTYSWIIVVALNIGAAGNKMAGLSYDITSKTPGNA